MRERRDQLIGVRFTKDEKRVIESLAEVRNLTLTDFVREAVFSHINHLEENLGNLNIEFFLKKFKTILESINNVKDCVKDMKQEFNIYDFARIESNLLKTNRELENL